MTQHRILLAVNLQRVAVTAFALALATWYSAYSELSVAHGNTWWQMLSYMPGHAASAVAFLWLGELLIARSYTALGKIGVFSYIVFGWVALYWASLALSLALFWPASNISALSFVPITLVVERESTFLAESGGIYYVARSVVFVISRWAAAKKKQA